MTEKQFQAEIVRLATMYGWGFYAIYDSRRSNPGWPVSGSPALMLLFGGRVRCRKLLMLWEDNSSEDGHYDCPDIEAALRAAMEED